MVEKVLKPHVSWLASQVEPSNDLIPKVGALGGRIEIAPHALREVFLGMFRAFVLVAQRSHFVAAVPCRQLQNKSNFLFM
jgi:hypothetical protein